MAKSKKVTAVQFPNGETYKADYGLWRSAIDAGRAVELYGKEGEAALHEYRRVKLLEIIHPKDTLTTVCTAYSRSSGAARYKVLLPGMDKDGRLYIRNITRQVAEFVGFKLSKDDEIVMGGYGYSKSFQIGYSLGFSLWPNGTPEVHGTRNGEPDRDGGYALSVNGF